MAAVALVGRWLDGAPLRTSRVTVLVVGLLQLGLLSPVAWLTGMVAVLWAASVGATPVVLQSAVLRVAGPRGELTSSAYVIAYQAGIALGTWAGGLLLDRPLPLTGTAVGSTTVAVSLLSLTTARALRRPAGEIG